MAVAGQYDFLFAIGMLFAFLDAWNIGANDVANSFATSVSSRSLTLMQAMIIASFMEFGGAVLVGGRVADTIRNKIVLVENFENQPYVLMLGMVCALVGSSTWLTIATSIGMPVSTTHCIVGGVIGMGVATLGADGIVWGWKGKGVAQIIASWFVAPAIAGGFATIIFLITKYAVLKRKNPLKWGFLMVPMYFGLTSGILTMVIVWKGAPNLHLDKWNDNQVIACVLGVTFTVIALCLLFFVPYLHRLLVKEDWTLKWYHIFLGPLLYKRGPVPEAPEGTQVNVIQDYYRGHATRADLEAANIKSSTIADMEQLKREKDARDNGGEIPARDDDSIDGQKQVVIDSDKEVAARRDTRSLRSIEVEDAGPWYKPKNLSKILVDAFLHGVRKDVVEEQSKASRLAGNIHDVHARAAHFDNKTEHLYSFLQVLTAATASFAHGANDVSNAVGPLSTIYLVWHTGKIGKKADVPIWVLAYGGAAIIIGLWTYGYNIMRNMGNRLTLQSPSRGFSMELGAAVTVVMATRLSLPISTTQCIVGATMGVALCNGDVKALNWRMVAWCYAGWIITLPVAGVIAGCLMGIIINAPTWVPPAHIKGL